MSATARAFLAIAVPEDLSQRLARLQRELAAVLPSCRWPKEPPFHATLAFLGDVEAARLGEIAALASRVAEQRPRTSVAVKGIGGFPSSARARVIWCGLEPEDHAALFDLQRDLIRQLKESGFQPDDRPFHPHVTVGRKSSRGPGANLTTLPPTLTSWRGGTFLVREITLFARFGLGGSAGYTAAATIPW
jgi:2'-5' RNA ligase